MDPASTDMTMFNLEGQRSIMQYVTLVGDRLQNHPWSASVEARD